jgi:hypothetical protein
MYALFNKDKNFIGFSPEIPHQSLLSKKISSEQSDLRSWRWEGDYDTGRMVSLDSGYPIEEIELEKMLFSYIEKKYPLPVQLTNIMNQLRKIIENNDSLQDDSFMDMSDCIKNAVDKHNKRVNYYKNYYKMRPKDESKQYFNNVFGKK